jgi:hypothetical protein
MTLYTTPDRTRYFLIPEDTDIPAGDLVLRTFAGHERSVDPEAVERHEVSEAEAREWAKDELEDVFGEMREKILGFTDRLKGRTAEMREENRRVWGAAADDPELAEATDRIRSGLKDLGRAIQRLAKDGMERAEAEGGEPSSDPETEDPTPPGPETP